MNIYDVAKLAGVSTATVSRVINHTGNVSEKTRCKVENIIEEFGFLPNDMARGLATKSSKTIGIMVSDIRNPFHAESAFELEQRLHKIGYSSILCNTTEDLGQKFNYLNLLSMKQVDGIITVGAAYGEPELIAEIQRINVQIPVVMLNNCVKDIISVYCDEKIGMKEALSYLKKQGYKKPIYIGDYRIFETRACRNKREGYLEGMKVFYPECEAEVHSLIEDTSSYEKFIVYLKDRPDIDAIQFEKDTSAIKFMKLLISQGFEIPEEIAIIGFDNIDITEFTQKKISTIDHKIIEHCDTAVQLLEQKLKGEEISLVHKIIPEFIPKETT